MPPKLNHAHLSAGSEEMSAIKAHIKVTNVKAVILTLYGAPMVSISSQIIRGHVIK